MLNAQATEISVVGGGILCWLLGDGFLLRSGKLRIQLIGDGARDFAFHSKDIIEFAVIAFRPEMFVRRGANQLHIDVNGIGDFLHAALEKIRHTQLLADLTQVLGRTLVFLRRGARNDLKRGNLRKPG